MQGQVAKLKLGIDPTTARNVAHASVVIDSGSHSTAA
jgi:hypothetical protein